MRTNGDVRSPVGLPRDTWGATLTRTVREFKEDRLNHWAAALTYYAILSIFPALLVLVSFVGLVANPERITKIVTDTVSQGLRPPPRRSEGRSSRSPPTAAPRA